jgi:hypothetical protein
VGIVLSFNTRLTPFEIQEDYCQFGILAMIGCVSLHSVKETHNAVTCVDIQNILCYVGLTASV